MSAKKVRSALLGLSGLALIAAAVTPLVHCAAPSEEEDGSSGESAYGEENSFGLRLTYNEGAGKIEAVLPKALAQGYTLRLNVRRGKMEKGTAADTEKAITSLCGSFKDFSGARKTSGVGVQRYEGPEVPAEVKDLVDLYNKRYAAGQFTPAPTAEEIRAGVDPIVEGCVLDANGKAKAVVQTNLAYAWDLGRKLARGGNIMPASVRILAGEAGGGGTTTLTEGERMFSQLEYAHLCTQEDQLGEIPFFPKISDGKYEDFDCRDLVANGVEGDPARPRRPLAGVEGAMIPVHVNDVEQTKCTDHELGLSDHDYDCMKEADRGMFLASGGVQPGPMVVTAKNKQGTHWVLLCRKISDGSLTDPAAKPGMTRSKVFNDVAMIGHNPQTGRTCFFQNSINSGRDGAHVPHPGDVQKSTNMWSAGQQAYCSDSCHSADPFVNSPWIDGAKRRSGIPIVPRMGEDGIKDDFPVSRPDRPYNIVNGGPQGHTIPKQITAPEAEACTGCHRMTVGSMSGNFTDWGSGRGDIYQNRLTETGRNRFEYAFVMPPLKDMNAHGVHSREEFDRSDLRRAIDFIQGCNTKTPTDEQKARCMYDDVPRGDNNQPPVPTR